MFVGLVALCSRAAAPRVLPADKQPADARLGEFVSVEFVHGISLSVEKQIRD
jgi:hypothetical protein